MEKSIRRLLSFVVALFMILSMVPGNVFEALAVENQGRETQLPTATVTPIKNENLTFGLNFKADEATKEQLFFYGDWYADFVLTINKDVTFHADGSGDGWLAGEYGEYGWIKVPFNQTVTLNAGESVNIMEQAAQLMGEPGLRYTYAEVYEVVKDFDCGVYFDQEFLEANPDLEVTLELRMFDPNHEGVSYVIGETHVFTLPVRYVAENVQTGVQYVTVYEALMVAAEGQTVRLLTDVIGERAEALILVMNNRTLDLDGYILEATNVITTSYGAKIMDSTDGNGLLKIEKDHLTVIHNDQLPIWNAEENGYHFVNVKMRIYEVGKNASELLLWYWFLGALDGNMKEHLAKIDENDLQVIVRVDYTDRNGNAASLDILVPDSIVLDYTSKEDPYFWVSIRGLNKLEEATITTYAVYGDVEIAGATYQYTKVPE